MGDLRIEVEFLTGRCAAADPFHRERAEWPPSPARLFAAFAAAAFEMGDKEALEALRWLENQMPPTVHAAGMTPRLNHRGETPQHFVPVNDTRSQERKRVPRVFPSVSLAHPVAQFVWRDTVPAGAQRRALLRLAALVPYLGESASVVRVAIADKTSDLPTYEPARRGDLFMRVPFAGQLDELARNYALDVNPPAGVQHAYQRKSETRASRAQPSKPRDGREVFIFRLGNRPNQAVTHALQITAAVRQTLVALANDHTKTVPPVLHGHSPDGARLQQDHVVVAPLPFVTGNRADGRVLGFMVMLPPGLSEPERQACYHAIGALKVILLPGGNEFSALRCHAEEATRTLRADCWSGPAKIWVTATPAVLNRFPGKRADKTLESIVHSMCKHVGVPPPVSFVFQPASFRRGIPHARHFLTRRPHWRPLPHGHLRLEFAEPVCGPLVIGSCRHYGLGLMLPLTEEHA